jgi:hypothetical protein
LKSKLLISRKLGAIYKNDYDKRRKTKTNPSRRNIEGGTINTNDLDIVWKNEQPKQVGYEQHKRKPKKQ